MSDTVQKLFNETLPRALARNAEAAQKVGAKYQLFITGPSGGEWNVVANASGTSCTPGRGPADCTITISAEDFQTFLENPAANSIHLVFQGKLKISGNPMLGQKLQRIFALR
jgi:putative sterol carrier protein